MRLSKVTVAVLLFGFLSFLKVEAAASFVSSEKDLLNALKLSKPFDTVLITGFYCLNEPLVISKPLVLIGINNPSLDFQSLSAGLVLTADSIEISGLGIFNIKRSSINDYAAVYAEDVENVNIHNNRILNAFFGVYLANSKFSKVHHNYIKGHSSSEQTTGNAVHSWQCDSIHIYNNYVTQHRDGIYLEFVTNSKITENVSEANIRYGLHFMFSHHDVYKGNEFLKNEAGVAVMYSNHVAMINNLFQDNWGDCSYGLLLKDIYDGELTNNVFIRNTVALLMEGSNRLVITKNEFGDNGWAFKIAANCEGNNVNNNAFSGNSFDIATNGLTVMNTFNNNYWDHYEGYDLDRDGVGDVPYHPVSLFSVMVERVPESLMLYRSFLTFLLDKAEHVMPSITPADLVDKQPLMKSNSKVESYAAN